MRPYGPPLGSLLPFVQYVMLLLLLQLDECAWNGSLLCHTANRKGQKHCERWKKIGRGGKIIPNLTAANTHTASDTQHGLSPTKFFGNLRNRWAGLRGT
ncbi:hypothetical protein XELAEV_18023440mg [Xenopus laevis]|uniref:Secreted protein n=1 Tax=Xenopus laevis TaxID=8355 RepID=A0A974D735_XENLA|nr:hypothetical protein XELAEV_18023440mg [Xenopus laevis]